MTAPTPDQAAAQIEREKFEAWAASENFVIDRDSFDDYRFGGTRDAWHAWHAARRELLARQVPEATIEARIAAAVQVERDRCREIAMDMPLLGEPTDEGDGDFYWDDKCKAMAFDISSRIRSPEWYDRSGKWIGPQGPAAPTAAGAGEEKS